MTAMGEAQGSVSAPSGLGTQGGRFWHDVASTFDLRQDELRVLEQACRTVDELELLNAAMAGAQLTVAGSMGQDRPNPLLGEIRAHRMTLAALVKQLALPDDDETKQEKAATRSSRASAAARARWDRRGA